MSRSKKFRAWEGEAAAAAIDRDLIDAFFLSSSPFFEIKEDTFVPKKEIKEHDFRRSLQCKTKLVVTFIFTFCH